MILLQLLEVILVLQFGLVDGSEISQSCVCGHVHSQNDCQNSGFCYWQDDKCILKSGQEYNKKVQNQIPCKNFAEEDCREQDQCGFHLSQCIDFKDCMIFNKDLCQESSYRCVSDGQKCVEIQECKNYKTEIGCSNKNQKGQYCVWVNQNEIQCKDVALCEELPIYLRSHKMCKTGLDGCTLSNLGYGCIKQMETCKQYQNNFQCFESQLNQDNCFWDELNNKCVDKVCENLPFSQDYECSQYLSECTTNGIHCIKRKQCSDAQNKFGCVTDVQGRKCEYHQNQCKIKSCLTASQLLGNYLQCQDYDISFDCVTSENGGCKPRPETCQGYVAETDCQSIKKQDCVWFENKCEQRQCHHAPSHYTHEDCKQYGNCIGKLNGSCRTTPQICEEILEQQFCEFIYSKNKCIWLNNNCTLLECNKLKVPFYKSHAICQAASQFCTFKLESLGCADYVCENVFEIEYCNVDSTGTICTLNQGCIEKKCSTAPTSYDTNSKCQQWLQKCTVNVQFVQNQKILIGCVDKTKECKSALQEQCYTTISGLYCQWNISQNKCLDLVCADADPTLYKSNENCRKLKVRLGTCIIGSTGVGCQMWPNDCLLLQSKQQCNLNLEDGTLCIWTGSYCKKLECSDAPKLSYTNNIDCNSWLDHCIFKPISGGCQDRSNSVACTSNPNNSMYDTHQECFAWNPKCTVVSSFKAEGCEKKKETCQEFIRQRNCKTNISGQICYWDDYSQTCKNEDQNNDGVADCNRRIYGDLTHQNCENFLSKCTISNIYTYCGNLQNNCENYNYEQNCVITYQGYSCKWDYQNQLCKNQQCTDNTSAQTEAECLNFILDQRCQLKIKSNGTYGVGCEQKPNYCSNITNSMICRLTKTISNNRCYYFDSQCSDVTYFNCHKIQDSKSNEECQSYNSYCILQSSGQGCYSVYSCGSLSEGTCNNAVMKYNQKCNYYIGCRNNNTCSQLYLSYSACDGKKAGLGQLCYFIYSSYNSQYYCQEQNVSKVLSFSSVNQIDRIKQCQEYSSTYKYDTVNQICIPITSCDQQYGIKQICNSSVTSSYLEKCGFNFQTNTCQRRICEHLTYANYSVITNEICYNWNFDCILDTTGCKTYSYDCTTIKLIYQCLQFSSCFWQNNNCVNYLTCEENTTSVSDLECQLMNRNCRLNYFNLKGCSYNSCQIIKDSTICNSTTLVNGSKCYWNGYCYQKNCTNHTTQSSCENSYGYFNGVIRKCYWCPLHFYQCSNYKYCSLNSISQPQSHQDCNDYYLLHTIYFYVNQMCTVKKQNCSDYLYQQGCVVTIGGIECFWNTGVTPNVCANKCDQLKVANPTNLDCYNFSSYCMSDGLKCQPLDCLSITTISDCSIFLQNCFWNGAECKVIGKCIQYNTSSLCTNTKNSEGISCFWDGTTCLEKSCSNKPSSSLNQSDCNSWLSNCQHNPYDNSCIELCETAGNSYLSHQQCETYYENKNCTLKVDLIQCVDLPVSCSLAKQTQCYLDKYGNQCFFKTSTNQCTNLECSNLDATYTTHQKCRLKLNICTVNATLNGCQNLNDCNSYLVQEQCQIDNNNVECQWINNQNKCTIKQCSTAQLTKYSAHGCHLYYGNSCTVNANLDGCEIGQPLCMKYKLEQCISEGQSNLTGVGCFWDENKGICLERVCENGPSLALSHSDCIAFLSTCQKGGCRIKGCFDYYYAIDSACASIFEDKRCATNGYQCILRNNCEDAQVFDSCTFDIKFNTCIWIDDKCYTKSCETALVSFKKYEECNSYLPYCTVKSEGGCVKKEKCHNYLIKEACYADIENGECIWDDSLNQCFQNQCQDFCGDGIVSSKNEQCDDGNYLPYDGCYKCQVQCPQGCTSCKGMLCDSCSRNGWKLINDVCQSSCGDGYVVGTEQCDDGNDIPFDGCYQCNYSCHQRCIICFQGDCIQCEIGFVEQGALCISICGDGNIAQKIEQCDDGNLENNDGCSDNCIVEQNWKCNPENNISVCIYTLMPSIILTKLSKTDLGIQEFELAFSEPVCLNITSISDEQFLQMIFVDIENAKDNQYDFEIKPITSITTQLKDVSYKILIYIKSSLNNPVLKVKIMCENIVNIYNNTLIINEGKMALKSFSRITNEQQSLIQKAAFLTQIVLYFIFAVSGVAFLCGNLEILWNLLDMLQQLSYMKYHNIQFPQNLQIYFEIFTVGSFTPIVNILSIDLYLQKFFNFQVPQVPAKWKFEYYQVNCYFLENFETLLTLITFGFGYYVISYFSYKFMIFIRYFNWPATSNKNYTNNFIKITKFIFSIEKLARKYYQYFIYSGLIRIYTSSFYELTFSSVLQLMSFDLSTTLNAIISSLALIVLLFNFFLTIFIFSILSKKKKIKKNLSVLIEGIKINAQKISRQYFFIVLLKKILFMINLVVLQGLMSAQSLITACLSGLFACYIQIYKPFENKFENMKLIIIEIMIMLNAIIFSVYEIIKYQENKNLAELLGWFNVACFTLILTLTLLIDIYQQLSKYQQKIVTKFRIWFGINEQNSQKQSMHLFAF